jgi:hypothetical protein
VDQVALPKKCIFQPLMAQQQSSDAIISGKGGRKIKRIVF